MTVTFRVTKVSVGIPVDYRFWSYQNSLYFKSWYSCSFQRYLTPGRRYASSQLLELTDVAFGAPKFLPTMEVDIPVDCCFQSYQTSVNFKTSGRRYASRQLLDLINVAFAASNTLSTVRVDFPVYCSFQNYQNLVSSWSWNLCRP